MPIKDAVFWIGLTMFGTGIYFITDAMKKWWRWAFITLMLLGGAAAVAYSEYDYLHPKAGTPHVPIWVYLLLLTTWCGLGYDVYDRRRSRKLPLELAEDSRPDRKYPWNVFTLQQQPKVSFAPAAQQEISHKTKLTVVLTNATGKDIHVWSPIWESREVPALEPFASKIRLELIVEGGWKANKWGEETQCLVLPCAQTFQCWVGLTEPATRDGLIRRVQKENTGTLIFPVKIDAKLYEVPIKV